MRGGGKRGSGVGCQFKVYGVGTDGGKIAVSIFTASHLRREARIVRAYVRNNSNKTELCFTD